MLTTDEAARRLGVKVSTLYAYVSRGLLESHRDPARRGSLFDLAEVEGLAARSRGGRQTATRLATITTGVTQLDQELGPRYRGRTGHRAGGDRQLRGGGRSLVGDRRRWRLVTARPRPVPTHPDAGPHALGPGAVRRDRPPAVRPATGRGGVCRPARRGRADRRGGSGARGWRRRCPPGGPAGGAPDRVGCRSAGRRRERRPRPHGGPRARHLHHGGARRRRRCAPIPTTPCSPGWRHWPGRCTVGPASRPTSCWSSQSATARRVPSTTSCASTGACPDSGTRCTRAATPVSTCCWRCPSPC